MRASLVLSAYTLVGLMAAGVVCAQVNERTDTARPKACSNHELMKAIRIIEGACNDISCDFSRLQELDSKVDKASLLAALRDPYLRPVHVFYPENVSALEGAFDWRTIKKAQLDSVKFLDDPENAVIYILGRASITGNKDHNVALSRERMRGVMNYLKNVLKIKCRTFHGGWLGRDILQLSRSDSRILNIEPTDYRNDPLVLNQSVHIFVFPCGDLL